MYLSGIPLGKIQLNLSTTATLGTEGSGRCRDSCREVLFKSQCMDFLSAGTKNSGHCREVAVSGGSTVGKKAKKKRGIKV